MFTNDTSACTTGAAPVVVVPAAGSAVLTATTAAWYRHIDGFGFPVNHKRLARRPVIPIS